MRQAPHIPAHYPPDNPVGQASDSGPKPSGAAFIQWLKHFALYLGAVAVACATGLFFLWQIVVMQDVSQMLKNVGDTSSARPLSATAPPPVPTAKPPETPPQSPANAPSILAGPPSAPADDATAATPPATEIPGDPNAPPIAPEQQAAAPADGQTDPAAPLAETPTEDAPPSTPPAEIEQLLAEAQQQMENRRLTAPASGNALRSYQRVLELEPNNPAALDGIQRIAAYYQDIARQSLLQNRTDESLAYINRGLRAAPRNEVLLNLRREARLARQREQEQRQALLEARQRQEVEQAERIREQFDFPPEAPPQARQPWWQQQYNESGFNQR
ncbi:MAG TPA: hypothetical protein GX399_10620 [Xanthomonadaceae bacterium]|nr:hypothetical protein [Xanthomonadaceae bacterium]